MKSVKPGRGPSMMGGVGAIGAGLFGIIWTFGAASMGAPGFFVLFGIVFIGISIFSAVYNLKNATSENRMSVFDITENEPDPLNLKYGRAPQEHYNNTEHRGNQPSADKTEQNLIFNGDINFCPSCGHNVANTTYSYCPSCGQAIRSSAKS